MPTTLRALFTAVVGAAILANSLGVGAQSPAAPPAGFPAVGAAPIVTVTSTGAAPRTALRYGLTAGGKTQMVMTMAMSNSISVGGTPMMAADLPVLKTTVDLNVTAVAANGDATYDFAITGMTAEAPPGGDPAVAAAMQQSAGSISGTKISATMTNRGFVTAEKVAIDPANPAFGQALSQMAGSMESMAAPLPAEAVGPGARWEVRQTLHTNGAIIYQRTLYELVSVDGRVVKLNAKSEQTGPRQTVSGPGIPAGMTMNIEELIGSGTGTMTLRLDSPAPAGEITGTTSMAASMDMNGTVQKMEIEMKVKVSLSPTNTDR